MIRYYLSSNNEMCYSTKINNFSPNNKQQSKHACTVHPKKADQGTTAVLGSFAPDLRECTVVVSEPVMGTIEIGNTSVSCIAFACVFGTCVVSWARATGQGILQSLRSAECERRACFLDLDELGISVVCPFVGHMSVQTN